MLQQQFRNAVYQSIQKRADAFSDLLDAMTLAGHVSSPVALSEETPFQRKFSSVFDTLQNTELDFDLLLPALYEHQPADSELIAGYEICELDTTPNERPEAETLEERVSLKSKKDEPVRYGHKYSWLTRLSTWEHPELHRAMITLLGPCSELVINLTSQAVRQALYRSKNWISAIFSNVESIIFLGGGLPGHSASIPENEIGCKKHRTLLKKMPGSDHTLMRW